MSGPDAVKRRFTHPEIRRIDGEAEILRTTYGPEHPGGEIVWRRWGAGPDLVLLHGGAGSWLHWIRNIDSLKLTRTVWIPDLPGFGESSRLEEAVDADVLAPIVVRGLRELLDGRVFDLVGFSFGGLTSALIAASNPPGLGRLLLVSVAAMGMMDRKIEYRSVRELTDPSERAAAVRHNINALMLNDPESIDDLAVEVHEYGTRSQGRRTRSLVRSDILYELSRRWSCDAYAYWSTGDILYAHQLDRLRDAAERLNLSGYRIAEAKGHWTQYEAPESFHAYVAGILGTESTTSRGEKHA